MKGKNQSTWKRPLREETRNKNNGVSSLSSGSSLGATFKQTVETACLNERPFGTSTLQTPCSRFYSVIRFCGGRKLERYGPHSFNCVSYFVCDCSFQFRWTKLLEQTKWLRVHVAKWLRRCAVTELRGYAATSIKERVRFRCSVLVSAHGLLFQHID